jgi:hypothetical protein
MSKCNVCWEPLNGALSVAPCGHCFCACPRALRDATPPRAAARSQRLAAAAPRAHRLCGATALLRAGVRADARARTCSRAGDQHAEAVLEQCEGCPQCGGPISNQTLKVVPVDPQEAIVKVRWELGRARSSARRPRAAHALRAADGALRPVPREHHQGGARGLLLVDRPDRQAPRETPVQRRRATAHLL